MSVLHVTSYVPLELSLMTAGAAPALKGPAISMANLSPPAVRACTFPSTAASQKRSRSGDDTVFRF